MNEITRRKTKTVNIGSVKMGSDHPVIVQSMTNTPTADIDATVAQIQLLERAGSELVRLTVNDFDAMKAIPEIVNRLRSEGYTAPLIGDFHYNGHVLLSKFPEAAKALGKYRINPGNVGKGEKHDDNFATFIKVANEHNKPVRIGVNWGSLDQELLTELMELHTMMAHYKHLLL